MKKRKKTIDRERKEEERKKEIKTNIEVNKENENQCEKMEKGR